MQKYSDFFQTLHDERAPTGYLGRGTHYSVLRAVVFHDALGNPLPESKYLDFAVIWDEDHDDRVIGPIEKLYRLGLLPSFVMFGERKGCFTAILSADVRNEARVTLLDEKVREVTADVDGDHWPSEIGSLENRDHAIISDSEDKVQLYLKNLMMLWKLGLKSAQEQSLDAELPIRVHPERRGIKVTIAKDGRSFDVCIMVARDGTGGTELKQLYRGRQAFDKALSMAETFSNENGFDGLYEVTDETEPDGQRTFETRAQWTAVLKEIDRQLAPLKVKSGLDWSSRARPITPELLAGMPPIGPQLARLMNLRASVHRRLPQEL